MPKYFLALTLFLSTPLMLASQDQPVDVSLIQLIATPERFHGKLIRVTGYLHNQFEDSAIYFSKTDADYLTGQNGLWVDYAEKVQKQPLDRAQKIDGLEYFDSKYVLIEGYFNKDAHGHFGAFAGSIIKVRRIMEETRWFDGNKHLQKN